MSASGHDPMAPSEYTKEFFSRINNNQNVYSRYSEVNEYNCDVLGSYSVKYLIALKWSEEDTIPGNKIYYKIAENCWKKVFETEYVAILENSKARPRYELNTDQSKLEVISVTNNKTKLKYSTDSDGYLIVRNNWYPGWKASINGVKYDMEKYDNIFQKVKVSKGSGTIDLSYEPRSFKAGSTISLVGLAILLIAIII
jgi:uncharacterized membrane protein YfhO